MEPNKTKVLIIEDEPALADIYSTKLNMSGMEALVAADGVAGVDMAQAELPHVIVLDLVMPLKDGFEVLKDLKDNPTTRPIPVIIMSNLGQDYEVRRGLELGASRFLVKANVEPEYLVSEIKNVLNGAPAPQSA
jgi:two-component system alkaline phosphatase synthesis response regulator PhoP